jgi:tyrosinase
LTPFWNTQSTYWESTQVTTTASLGYAYPEFNGLDLGNPAAVRTAIAQKVNQLYGGASPIRQLAAVSKAVESTSAAAPEAAKTNPSPAPSSNSNSTPAPAPPAAPHVQANLAHTPAPQVAHQPTPQHPVDHIVYDWTARIEVKKYEVGGSFLVLLFLGVVPDDPRQWRSSPNFVGAHHVFANRSVPFDYRFSC